MGDKNAEKIIDNYNRLLSEKSLFTSMFQDIANFILPRKNKILMKRSPGSRSPIILYDSTAIHSCDLLASSLQGAFSTSWFALRFVEDDLNEVAEAREWLDEATKKMYIALQRSNAHTETQELFLDLVAFGTGCMLIEEQDLKNSMFNGLRFKSYAVEEYVIDENAEGFVDTVIREAIYTPRQAIQRYGDAVGAEVTKMIQTNDKRKIKYLHATFPAKEFDGKIQDKFPVASIIVDRNNAKIIKVSGDYDFPYVVPRWSKTASEKWGWGRGEIALPEAKTLNKTKELNLKSLAKDIDPPLAVADSMEKLNLSPGHQNPMRVDLVERGWKPLMTGSRSDVAKMNIEDMRQSIKEVFYTEQLQMQKKAQMTATEAQITFELMQRLLGPAYGRLGVELYAPKAERIFGIMARLKAFGLPPKMIENREVHVQYVGPLAKAQGQEETQAIQNWLQMIASIAGMKQDVIDVPNFDVIARESGQSLGVLEKYMNSKEDIKTTRNQRAQSIQAQQNQQSSIDAAKALPNVAKVLQEQQQQPIGGA